MSNMINSIPEDYDDDDYQLNNYQQPHHSNMSIPDNMYEDKSKFAGLRQTSLSQIGGKKRFRPPTVITPMNQHSHPTSKSPSQASFHSQDRNNSLQWPPQQQQQQQHPHPQHPQQYMYQNHPQYHQQQQHARPQYYQQQHQQQQQQPMHFQPPIQYNQYQRSANSLISPSSSNFQLTQPPNTRRYDNQSTESLTPSSSFDRDNELPITPESLEEHDSLHESIILDLNTKNESLSKENIILNDRVTTLNKLLQDKEQELQLKNNIIEAKSKQLTLREEKLNNRDKQIEILNRKVSNVSIDDNDDENVKLQKTNKELSAKVISLLTEIETLKETEHDKLAKVNKELSAKIVSLLEEIELLRSQHQLQNAPPSLSKPTSLMPQSSPKFGNGNRTIKDLSKEELFKLEFLNILDTLNQNQYYYENKIKNLQESVENQKKMISSISNIRKNVSSPDEVKKGFKILNIVPSTL